MSEIARYKAESSLLHNEKSTKISCWKYHVGTVPYIRTVLTNFKVFFFRIKMMINHLMKLNKFQYILQHYIIFKQKPVYNSPKIISKVCMSTRTANKLHVGTYCNIIDTHSKLQ